MLTNYVFITPIKMKTTEEVVNALKHVYAICGGSKTSLVTETENFPANNSLG